MMKKPERIRVLIVDDHKIFRQGLRSLLEDERDIKVVGESSNTAELMDSLAAVTPDVIVMDISMPGLSGLQATRMVKSDHPSIRILILSMSGDEETVEQAIQVGVDGFLVKETAASDLLSAIREVNRGNAFFSPSITKVLLSKKHDQAQELVPSHLTLREREILQLIATSRTNKEISVLLNISHKTVDKHRQRIMTKLKIHDIAGLTRYAIAKGLLR
jgi:DNA-binding NarL/FixJ family response regulator